MAIVYFNRFSKYLLSKVLILLIVPFSGKCQIESFLTAEEKAHLYLAVMKSPTLKRNLEHAFEYSGETVLDKKGKIDYNAIHEKITVEPSLLQVYISSIKQSSNGIVAETATKIVLWRLQRELNLVISKDQDSPLSE